MPRPTGHKAGNCVLPPPSAPLQNPASSSPSLMPDLKNPCCCVRKWTVGFPAFTKSGGGPCCRSCTFVPGSTPPALCRSPRLRRDEGPWGEGPWGEGPWGEGRKCLSGAAHCCRPLSCPGAFGCVGAGDAGHESIVPRRGPGTAAPHQLTQYTDQLPASRAGVCPFK